MKRAFIWALILGLGAAAFGLWVWIIFLGAFAHLLIGGTKHASRGWSGRR